MKDARGRVFYQGFTGGYFFRLRTATAAAAEEASRTTAPAARVTPVGGITGVSPPAPEGSEASEESGDGPGIRLRIGSVHQRLIGGLGGGQHGVVADQLLLRVGQRVIGGAGLRDAVPAVQCHGADGVDFLADGRGLRLVVGGILAGGQARPDGSGVGHIVGVLDFFLGILDPHIEVGGGGGGEGDVDVCAVAVYVEGFHHFASVGDDLDGLQLILGHSGVGIADGNLEMEGVGAAV